MNLSGVSGKDECFPRPSTASFDQLDAFMIAVSILLDDNSKDDTISQTSNLDSVIPSTAKVIDSDSSIYKYLHIQQQHGQVQQ